MAVLPPIRKLYLEDFASQRSWISPFLYTINNFMTSVVGALTKDLNLIDNTTSDIKSITLVSAPTVAAPASVAWTKNTPPIAVLVGNVTSNSSSFSLSSAVQVVWAMSPSGLQLQITKLVGVTPTNAQNITLTLVCISG